MRSCGYPHSVHRTDDAPEPDVMAIFDEVEAVLACRLCGAVVAPTGPYPRIHWDWHETPNGA